MERAVTAADANRKFSRLLENVRKGHSYVVTSHGRPVARIAPIDEHEKAAVGARSALLARLRSEPILEVGRWRRDELYERAQ